MLLEDELLEDELPEELLDDDSPLDDDVLLVDDELLDDDELLVELLSGPPSVTAVPHPTASVIPRVPHPNVIPKRLI